MTRKIIIASLTALLSLSFAQADTIIPGGYVSGTWTAAGSPYLVQGNITIHTDSTLNINPGVEVNFQGSFYGLTVNGLLEAVGTEADSIHFTSSTFWMGLNFTNAPDSSRLTFCTISHSGIMSIAGMGGINCTSSNPVITHCRISDNYAHPEIPTYAGGIALNNSNAEISWCDIRNNESGMCGGGLTITNCSPVITGCNISGNETLMYGGGIYITGNSNPMITNCTIDSNTSNMYGGGISVAGGVITISECTIGYNRAYDGGGGLSISGGSVSLDHCTFERSNCCVWQGQGGGIFINGGTLTVAHCTLYADYIMNEQNGMEIYTGGSAAVAISNSIIFSGYYLVTLESSILPSLTYNDFYIDPIYPQAYFYGNAPPGLGALTQINANGDSCDVYHNIYLPPLFVNQLNDDLHLTESSPCIDAGDPASLLDPDSTIADMGCYFFDQRMPDIELSTSQLDFGAVTIGESADLPLTLYNLGGDTLVLFNLACGLTAFSTNWNPSDSLVLPGDSLEITVTFTPDDTLDYADTLSIENNCEVCGVELLGHGEALGVSDPVSSLPEEFALRGPYPNPFNPVTTFKIELPVAGWAKLEIYNISGKSVATALEGWCAAGYHDVPFDGSGLTSGVYLFRLSADNFTASGKMVLLK